MSQNSIEEIIFGEPSSSKSSAAIIKNIHRKKLGREYLVNRIKPSISEYNDLIAFPSHFEIETINACNARCPMCTIDDWNKEEKMMKDSLFKKIAYELSENKKHLKRVNLYRDGEPLLDRKLPERVEYLKKLGIPNVSISTNVSLLTEQKAREILKAGMNMVTLSIDSLNKEVYESIRRGLVFEKCIENAINFIKIRNEMNSNCEIWIRMIRQESNKNEFKSYKDYWEKLKILDPTKDRIYFHNIFDWGGQLEGFKSISENTELHLPCVSLWSLMPIFANGDVPMCNVDYGAQNKIGNLNNSSIKELWNSITLNRIRNKHLEGKKCSIKMCSQCNVWEEMPPRDGGDTISSRYAKLLRP